MIRVLLLMVGILAGAVAPAAADVLTKITERDTIRIGYRADAPPFSYTSKQGEPAGLAVALCKEVARSIQRNGLYARIRTFPTHKDGLVALTNGAIDAYFGDSAILRFQTRRLGFGDRIELMGETFSYEPYAIAMKRGETRLRLAVDRALSGIYDNGVIYNLILNELDNFKISAQAQAIYSIVGLPE